MRLLRDDGAVVYLNGVEVFRSNMTNGPIASTNLASVAISGTDETNFVSAPVSPSLLRPGTNVIAVEIHQADVTSTDLSFDLELIANSALGLLPEMRSMTIDIQALIDGRDLLIVKGNTLQWHHTDWAAVGRHGGGDQPTIITTTSNGIVQMNAFNWIPGWPEPAPAGINYEAYSSVLTNYFPALPWSGMTVTLNRITSRDTTTIYQMPAAGNDYTLIFEFDDIDVLGSTWYHISVEIKTVGPAITLQPQSQMVMAGSEAVFSVEARGVLPLRHQWRHNGTNLPSATNAVLALSNVQTNRAGNYQVVVSDSSGSVTSAVARLTVASSGQTFSLIPTNSVWKYLDTGTNLGTAWKETNFNDSAWASGPPNSATATATKPPWSDTAPTPAANTSPPISAVPSTCPTRPGSPISPSACSAMTAASCI